MNKPYSRIIGIWRLFVAMVVYMPLHAPCFLVPVEPRYAKTRMRLGREVKGETLGCMF